MRALLMFSVAFGAAVLGVLLVLPRSLWLVLGALTAVAGLVLLCLRRWRPGAVVLLGLAAGLCFGAGYQSFVVDPALSLAGQTEQVTGMALDYSTEAAWGQQVPAKLTIGDRTVKVQVWLDTKTALRPGDRFTVQAELESAMGDNYYPAEGIFLLAYGQGMPEIMKCDSTPWTLWPRVVAHRMEESLRGAMPEDVLGFALALSTGNRTELSVGAQADMKTAGIYHALALSGMHLTTLVGTLGLLIRKKRRRSLVGIPVCILFTVLTGGRPSLVRACVMQCMLLLAPLLGREEDMPTSLGAAALVLMLQNPWCILGWGTQLSFTSMAGIALLSESLHEKLKRPWKALPKNSIWRKLGNGISASLTTSLSATVFTAPLLMAYFGMLSLVGPVTNLLTLWAITWCFRGSLLTAVVGCILPGPAKVLGWAVAWGFRYVALVAEGLAQLPFAALYTRSCYILGWVALCYGLGLLVRWTPAKARRYPTAICCLLVALTAAIGFSLLEERGAVAAVLDVGQGQCICLRRGGSTILVDCGGSGGARTGDTAADYLDSLGETRVDLLLLTHYDSDHTGGVEELLRRVEVSAVLLPDYQPENGLREPLISAAEAAGAEVRLLDRDADLTLGPWQVSVYAGTDDGNGAGLSARLETEGLSLLVTGDLDAEAEWRLLRTRELPQVDVLVAGHHGAKDSTSAPLLETVRPKTVVISVGQNSYGHPSAETLQRIYTCGATVCRTDLQGTLRIKGAG